MSLMATCNAVVKADIVSFLGPDNTTTDDHAEIRQRPIGDVAAPCISQSAGNVTALNTVVVAEIMHMQPSN